MLSMSTDYKDRIPKGTIMHVPHKLGDVSNNDFVILMNIIIIKSLRPYMSSTMECELSSIKLI